jgi:CRISPR-associated endonuclease/helicase Cas3
VLDEPDDFDLADLPALARLVHWTGLLGSRLLLSSATLAPAFVEGLFAAYLAGRTVHERNRGSSPRAASVCCAWFDEHRAQHAACGDTQSFAQAHRRFVRRRLAALRRRPVRQRAKIVTPETQAGTDLASAWAAQLLEHITRLHGAHRDVDPASGRTVSVGLVRMANIEPLARVTRELLRLNPPDGHRLHVCCYHSQHPLLVRSDIESRLDALLNRTSRPSLFQADAVREVLARLPEPHQVFVVLATPVAEVGRDHDYDWAVVEPSSMRSIIQVAGRVRRHRSAAHDGTNVLLLGRTFRDLKGECGPVFCQPGFESAKWTLRSHRLEDVVTPEQYREISAAPRIAEREPLAWQENLADLEHARLRALLLGAPGPAPEMPVGWWWETPAHLTAALQKAQRFRASDRTDTYVLLPDEDEQTWTFHRKERDGSISNQDRELERTADAELGLAERIRPWPQISYLDALSRLADDFELSADDAARRFGWVELRRLELPRPWRYHPALGFTRRHAADWA